MSPVMLLALVATCSGCGAYDSARDGVKQAAGWFGGTLVEYSFCEIGLVDCGHVYVCSGPPVAELCIDDDEPGLFDAVEAEFGECKPTDRHQGICLDLCDMESPLPGGQGCNAEQGCVCPVGELP